MSAHRTSAASAAIVLAVLTSAVAQAKPYAYISASEEVKPTLNASIGDDSVRLSGDSYLAHDYPLPANSIPNTAAYVNPVTLRMGALAIAESRYPGPGAGTMPPDAPISGWRSDRPCADLDLGYSTTVTVGAGSTSLKTGDPVRVKVSLRLDGSLSTGVVYPNPGSISSWAEVDAGLSIKDPSVRIDTGEGYIIPSLVSFGLSAELIRETWMPNPYYGNAGGVSLDSSWSWSLQTNVGPRQSAAFDDYDEDPYPNTPVSYPAGMGPQPNVMTVDTGLLAAEFDTHVGAVLDLRSDMYFLMQSRYNAPFAKADFLNTLGLDLSPAPGSEGISLTVAAVPEPATLTLLTLCATLLTLRRRHGNV